jgi:3-oxoacyl-[acyl-carrier protein] reductase
VDISGSDVSALASALGERSGGSTRGSTTPGPISSPAPAADLSRRQKLDLVLAVDLRGTILASWAAVETMRERGGVIVNMSWDHVSVGMAGENPILYSAAKGGIASFSRSLARQVAPAIRVNILAPGFIETAFGEQANQDWHRDIAERTPLRRWGQPEDVVGAPSSDLGRFRFMTGQMIMVNGGVVM